MKAQLHSTAENPGRPDQENGHLPSDAFAAALLNVAAGCSAIHFHDEVVAM